ncbi:aminotransferase class I/II-fold pyridoxal phosphate-dependent enzyme [Thalassomonas sp. RHCl1]|uniref:MalY/PatB family protein n=1 Tax=Thalassomonas sp. RHCl1 TaxID=2995320 RepID=UPI00248CF36D|nr:aminotransferase class I/II-fold pyridoxal phosphate-dependent enzyme [Thalassomonas sp. RHCl1]
MLNSVYGTTNVEPYWVADMDFEVATPIRDELLRLAQRAHFAYEFNSQDVLKAIVDWYQRRHDLVLKQENLVQVPGVLTGVAMLIRELTKPGDGVLIQTPVYHQFKKVIGSAGREVLRSPLQVIDGHYRMDFDDLEQQFSSGKVKVMLLCNPHNPVGRVWTQDELAQLLKLARAYQVFIISDEIHSDIIFAGHSFHSMAGFTGENFASLIGSPSKTFGMQSISNGYIYSANQDLLAKTKASLDSMYLGHSNVLSNYATIAAYTQGEIWLDEFLQYLENSINWIQDFLQQELPQVRLYPVEGTYQIWLDFSNTDLPAEQVKQLLVDARMALTPGAWFESGNELMFRMNIASPLAQIQEAFKRLQQKLSA